MAAGWESQGRATMTSKHQWCFIALLGAFLLAQLYCGQEAGVQQSSDSAIFVDMAKNHTVFSKAFLAGSRPPLTSLVLKLVSVSPRSFVAVQWLAHLGAWAGLAYFFLVRSRHLVVGWVLAVWVLVLATTPQVQIWNYYVLSESLSLTCLPLIFLLLPYSIEQTSRRRWLALAAVLLACALLRDLGAYLALALGVALALACFAAVARRRMPYALLGITILGFAFSSVTANVGVPGAMDRRWVFPFFNVVGQRILPDPARLRYFSERGMPVTDAVLGRSNKWASADTFAVFNDPALAGFRDWTASHGKSVYSSYLLSHPGYTVGEALKQEKVILHRLPSALAVYYPSGYRAVSANMPGIEASFLWVLLPAIVAIPFAVRQRRSGLKPDDKWRVLLAVAVLLPIPILMIVSYHGDAMEVARHSISVAVYARIYAVFAAFLLFGQREGARREAALES